MHILDDPSVSPRVRALLAGGRRGSVMSAEGIRGSARAEAADGSVAVMPAGAVEAMVRFEERYGGLWYPLLGSNGMEHGLDGDATVHARAEGWVFATIVDGDMTWPVNVLLDGRTLMTLGGQPRIINRSVTQRLEAHAQLAKVRRWPHVTSRIATEPGQEPVLDAAGLPALDAEATGPADRWWSDDGTAVHLRLQRWWGGEEVWAVRYFARRAADLSAVVEAAVPQEEWCALCGHFTRPEEPCLPR